ncbi:MAG: hypothetical protein AAB455_02930, partial [Patescibacteria group bacterium]
MKMMDGETVTHGRLYWICHNSLVRLSQSWQKCRRLFVLVALVVMILLAITRAWVQPAILTMRIYSFELIIVSLAAILLKWYKSRLGWRGWAGVVGLVGVIVANHWYFHCEPHRYLTLYLRYQSLELKELDELPETDYERIQPLSSIRVLAKEALTEVEQMSDPYFVRVDDQYRWTMSVEPSFAIPRLVGQVGEVVAVSATSASPNFSHESRHPVSFAVGEKLLLGKNTHIATIRSFGLARFLSYEPADVKYVKDDAGQWVELVSLIRWRGIFFPRPEFGGVQVIRQSQGGLWHWCQLLFFGEGERASAPFAPG